MPRGKVISVRFTDPESAGIEVRAAESGTSVSAYVRGSALSRPQHTADTVAHDLARIAVYLRQQGADAEIIAELRDVLRRL